MFQDFSECFKAQEIPLEMWVGIYILIFQSQKWLYKPKEDLKI